MARHELRLRDALPETSRYELLLKIAAGGMATVYVGRSRGNVSRLFALKRPHPHLADDLAFRKMVVAEARLASKIHHPNVVAVQDVEELDGELLLAMDYVEGLSLAEWLSSARGVDPQRRARVALRIVLDAAAGLHAAHELVDETGRHLAIVHRDVSPQNILVGVDGTARLSDFGIAKSEVQTGVTTSGGLKGKLAYMAAEYIESGVVDRRADVFALGVVAWEGITGRRLFRAESEARLMSLVLTCEVPPPSSLLPWVPAALDAAVLRAAARAPTSRFHTARAFAEALERAAQAAGLLGTHAEVASAVEEAAGAMLAARREKIGAHVAGASLGGEPGTSSELDDVIVEPSRTHTLDAPLVPTVVLPPRPVVAAVAPAPRASAIQAARGPLFALVVAALVAAVVGLRFVGDRARPVELAPPVLPPEPPALPPEPPVLPPEPPMLTTGDPPPSLSQAPASPSANDAGAWSAPRSSGPAAHPRTPARASAAANPPLPTRAPPNPYKDGGR
jgi:serine/threonine-protein kinase